MTVPSDKVTYFAATDARNQRIPFGIKSKDRLKHLYVIGKTGMGKSTMLENMAVQDIQSGEGMAFIDPHGKTADLLLEYVPEERVKDVIYFAPFDTDFPIAFNVMEDVGADKRHLVANGMMSAFKKLFGEESFSDRMQYILQNTILALLEYPNSTMLGINKMLVDKDYRNKVVDNVTDPSVKTYWTQEFAGYTERFAAEAIPAIQNKIGQFTSNPLVRNIIGQEKSSFDFRKIMDEKKIIIINLSKGRVGEANANLLGSLIITKVYLAAMSRADKNEAELAKLPNFYLYVDEFQSFANESFADILSEARKYKLNLTMAHQYIEQMSEEVRAAVFGNVGTMIVFRVGAYDAEVLEKEFAPTFEVEDLVNLGSFQIYLKLMIDGVSSQPFSAVTIPPIEKQETNFVADIIKNSRQVYASPKEKVEDHIREWHGESGRDTSKDSNGDRKEKRNSSVDNTRESTKRSPRPIDIRGKSRPESGSRQGSGKQDTNRRQDTKRQEKEVKKEMVEELPHGDFKPLSAISLKDISKKSDNQRERSEENIASLKDALKAVVGENPKSQETRDKSRPESGSRQGSGKQAPLREPEGSSEPRTANTKREENKKQEPEANQANQANEANKPQSQQANQASTGPSPDELKKILNAE